MALASSYALFRFSYRDGQNACMASLACELSYIFNHIYLPANV